MPSILKSQNRKTEALLLLAVQIVLLLGFALVFFGKKTSAEYSPSAVNINAASAKQLGTALSVSPAVAAQLVKARGRGWTSVYSLRHARALRNVATTPITDLAFVVRTPAQASRLFWGGVLAFLIAFWAAHGVLWKSAPAADPFLLPWVALLSGIGLMLVYSVKDPYRDAPAFSGQVWGIAVYGMLALIVPLTRPFGRLTLRRYQYVYAGAALLLMLGLLALGHGPGGIHIELFGIEPVEFIKLLLVLFVASYLADRRGMLGDPKTILPRLADFGPLVVAYAFCLGLFLLVKDLGPAVLLLGVFAGLLYLTTRRAMYPAVAALLLLLAAGAGYKLHFGFFATRVVMWLHPWDNADKNGAQLAQGLWGMATGGLWGSGLGLGHPEFVPRAGSDSIFATLGEQTGLIGSLIILAVYMLLIVRGLSIARRAGTEFDRLLASGLTLLLGGQTMMILGGVSGLTPLTGMTLPFVSFGASSLVAGFFAVGLLLQLSGKTIPADFADQATPEWSRAARNLAVGCALYLLVGVGIGRMVVVQGVQDTQIATRLLYTPDRDTLPGAPLPAHVNPRLLAYAAAIPRGAITDRNGAALARNPVSSTEPGQTALLCPEGRLRVYPGGPAFSQIVWAVERPHSAFNPLGADDRLRGFSSYAALLTPYHTQNLPFHRTPHAESVSLTLDSALQTAATNALYNSAGQVRDRRTGRPKNKGAAVLINVSTGEVLALASTPTFDPATLTPASWAALQTQPDGPVFSRAVSGLYPPGSAFKIVTATAGLENGLQNQIFVCRHTDSNVFWHFEGHHYSRKRITDEDGFAPHGVTDMAKALRVSCNIYFAHLGITMGAPALDQTARQKFDLSYMPPLQKLAEDLPDCAYGQGAVQVTPLEMGRVAQAVANNGRLLPSVFVKSEAKASGGTEAMSPAQAAILQTMLAGVVTDGTARGVFDGLPVSVAGKTGSAQNGRGDGLSHSWFVGFAPAVHPTVAFACIVENGGAGRAAAAPVCREMLRKAFAK
jgi:cell division protein FtsI/penicillin-binding protein 2/cell division protein FtsW (lipid II flippase)